MVWILPSPGIAQPCPEGACGPGPSPVSPGCPRGSPGHVSRAGPLASRPAGGDPDARAHPGELPKDCSQRSQGRPDPAVPSQHPGVLDPGANPLLPVCVAPMARHCPLLWRRPGGAGFQLSSARRGAEHRRGRCCPQHGGSGPSCDVLSKHQPARFTPYPEALASPAPRFQR